MAAVSLLRRRHAGNRLGASAAGDPGHAPRSDGPTHRMALEDVSIGFALSGDVTSGAIKVAFEPAGAAERAAV